MNQSIRIPLLPHQLEFCHDTETPYLLLLGGYGSGKTFGFAMKAVAMALLNAGYVGTIMEPTGPLLQDILEPALEEVLEMLSIPYKVKNNQQKPNYYIDCGNGKTTELRLRSAENWRRQIGSNLAFLGVDEIDTMNPYDAEKMIQKSKPRIRKGNVLQFFAATTPEGFGFCYNFWEKGKDASKRTIKAKTKDNTYLPNTYIPDLEALYPANLIEAYINGEYVNLRSGTVYVAFDRRENSTLEREDGKEPLHIGMDFNIEHMAAVAHVIRKGIILAVDEFAEIYDTTAMIDAIKTRYPSRTILVYPDASGGSRKTYASGTDIELLRAAGFRVVTERSNPAVRDRVNTMNAAFLNAEGTRRYFVNPETCPCYVECLEQQTYENGEPDKKMGFDHLNDAAGYCIHKLLPIKRPKQATQRTG